MLFRSYVSVSSRSPRASGAHSSETVSCPLRFKSSPFTRGSFVGVALRPHSGLVFPAYAGLVRMFLFRRSSRSVFPMRVGFVRQPLLIATESNRLPHSSGVRSFAHGGKSITFDLVIELVVSSSPFAWGSFESRTMALKLKQVFPICVGLFQPGPRQKKGSFPIYVGSF